MIRPLFNWIFKILDIVLSIGDVSHFQVMTTRRMPNPSQARNTVDTPPHTQSHTIKIESNKFLNFPFLGLRPRVRCHWQWAREKDNSFQLMGRAGGEEEIYYLSLLLKKKCSQKKWHPSCYISDTINWASFRAILQVSVLAVLNGWCGIRKEGRLLHF